MFAGFRAPRSSLAEPSQIRPSPGKAEGPRSALAIANSTRSFLILPFSFLLFLRLCDSSLGLGAIRMF